MYTTFHLESAQEVNADLLDAIKATFKSKPITIIVEEDGGDELTDQLKAILDDRLQEPESTYFFASDSIERLQKRHGL